MQAVAVVTGDEFLLSYNLSLGTEDLLYYIDQLQFNFTRKSASSYAFFDDCYGVDFTPIIGPSGICFNFNLVDAEALFNLDM
jgi:hypothetical protein